MRHNSNKHLTLWLIGLVSFGIIARLLPHPPNFSPIMAISLFVGVKFGVKNSLFAALPAMLISDYIIGFYSLPIMISVYGCIALSAVCGKLLSKQSSGKLVFGILSNALLFYLVTNWAVWQWGGLYPKTAEGLMQCYALALPFLRNSALSDLLFTGLLFALYDAVKNYKFFKSATAT